MLGRLLRLLRFGWAGLLIGGGLILVGSNSGWSFLQGFPAEHLPWAATAFALGAAWSIAASLLVVFRHGITLGILLLAAAAALAAFDQAGLLTQMMEPTLGQRAALVMALLGTAIVLPALGLALRAQEHEVVPAGPSPHAEPDPGKARDALALASLDTLTAEEASVLAWCSAYAPNGRFVASIENSPVLASLHTKGILDYSSADRQSFVLVVRPAVWAEVRDLRHVLASRGTAIPRDPPFRYEAAFAP